MNCKELKDSSERIGQLYPVLIDVNGRVIDGEHRLRANKHWRCETVASIKTEKELLTARLACNTVRRKVSAAETSEILTRLANIFVNEGTPIGKVTYKLANHTGMSYRWVAKYLPDEFKDKVQAEKRKNSVPQKAKKNLLLFDIPENELRLKLYSNTNFVSFSIEKPLFEKLKKKAMKLKTTPRTLLYNAILIALQMSKHGEVRLIQTEKEKYTSPTDLNKLTATSKEIT